MELIRGIHNIRTQHYGCVLTIGNFDGVHLGHGEVLNGLLNDAKKYNLPSTVMLFEPQPQEFFARDNAPARLTRLRDKLGLLAKLGVERVICISFNQQFANMEAEQFVTENESVYIPITAVHALENPGDTPLELIEVQVGSYLGEDDIVRFEDKYGRVQ